MKVVVYGEFGQYTTDHNEIEVESVGTPLALKRLKNKYRDEWAVYGDNWAGWLPARIYIFVGTLNEFRDKFPKLTKSDNITDSSIREGVFSDSWY